MSINFTRLLTDQTNKFSYLQRKNGYEKKMVSYVKTEPNLTVKIVYSLTMAADKYLMGDLRTACFDWFKYNWSIMAANGQLNYVFQDNTDGLLLWILGVAIDHQITAERDSVDD